MVSGTADIGLRIIGNTGCVNYLAITGGASGFNAKLQAVGANLLLGSGSAIATNAVAGHLMIPTCAGTPTGAPTGAGAGAAAIIVDSTNNKLYFYSTSAWRDAGP